MPLKARFKLKPQMGPRRIIVKEKGNARTIIQYGAETSGSYPLPKRPQPKQVRGRSR